MFTSPPPPHKLTLIEELDSKQMCSHKQIHSLNCLKVPEITYIGNNTLNIKCSCNEREKNMTIPSYLSVTEIICKETKDDATHTVSSLPEMFCEKCKCWLCKECSSLHESNNPNEEHKVSAKNLTMEMNCAYHPTQHIVGHCEHCEEYFCFKCLNSKNHEKHYIKFLDHVFNDSTLNEIKKDYKKALNYIRNQEQVYNSAVGHLQQKIAQLTTAYNLYLDNQYNVLRFIHLLMNSYLEQKDNYIIRKNLINNSLFNLKEECKTDATFEEVIKYFESSIILREGQRTFHTKKAFNHQIQRIIYFEENKSPITCIQVLQDGRIATCSRDNTVIVYSIDLDNFNLSAVDLRITNVHSRFAGVKYITEIREGVIATCGKITCPGANDSIQVHALKKSSSKKIGQLHGGEIVSMIIRYTKERFISCSYDGCVRIWDCQSFEKKNEWESHEGLVKAMLKLEKKNVLITVGDKDHLLKQWDLDTFEQLAKPITRITCPGPNAVAEIQGERLIMGAYDGVKVIDLKNSLVERKIVSEIPIDMNIFYALMVIGDLAYCVGGELDNGYLMIINLFSGENFYFKKICVYPVFSIKKFKKKVCLCFAILRTAVSMFFYTLKTRFFKLSDNS